MVSSMVNSVFNDPFFVGFNRELQKATNIYNSGNFPPYNIRQIDEDNFIIELAVAGFNEDELEVIYQDGTITIKGEKNEDSEEDTKYLHKGIATRKFTREFVLGSYLEVVGANIENGVLYVSLERNLPESMKPRHIKISHGTLDSKS
jgi:molecular chaperone IbpA